MPVHHIKIIYTFWVIIIFYCSMTLQYEHKCIVTIFCPHITIYFGFETYFGMLIVRITYEKGNIYRKNASQIYIYMAIHTPKFPKNFKSIYMPVYIYARTPL